MTIGTSQRAAGVDGAPRVHSLRPGRLLAAGLLAGPLFAALVAVQLVAHRDFDLSRHPISMLATGDHGWVQVATFAVTGLLVVAASRGVHHRLTAGRGRVWVPRLIALFGIGLIAAGIFVPDAENGYPAGTPDGPVATMSWHGIAHSASAAIGYNALIVAMVVFAVRLAILRRHGWAVANAAVALTLLVLLSLPMADGVSIRMAFGGVVAFGWLAALCGSLRLGRARRPGEPRHPR
ncbi:hypothetical protein GCM10027280_07810 [Micromonospora polyrhachis]|uniref:Putative membrane protein n=1 Tax=Micromonospora polyrhachis TaxID=1282883 RepID=A0A7W7SP51_9ACTN|nr:DUF998 domain-containing protein [Micromonospora polyrhachis]MBB4958357.1 putative membrane protein [Micromonospora polyrhachis]